jgi:hypothetical protein
MKQLFLVVAVALACAAMASGQTEFETTSTSDIFEIGTKKVRIPAPDGFTKIGPLYGHILSVQEAAEPADNEIFALHLPNADLPKHRSDFGRSPDFFTKVSVSRKGRNEEITPAGFIALGTYVEKEFAKITSANSPEMIAGQKHVSNNLSELLENNTKVKFDQPVNLGVFDKTARIHSTLALLNLSVDKVPYKFLGTVSFVYINMRLIYVYAYKANPVDADVEMLREFTKKWTASIVAANEDQIARGRR